MCRSCFRDLISRAPGTVPKDGAGFCGKGGFFLVGFLLNLDIKIVNAVRAVIIGYGNFHLDRLLAYEFAVGITLDRNRTGGCEIARNRNSVNENLRIHHLVLDSDSQTRILTGSRSLEYVVAVDIRQLEEIAHSQGSIDIARRNRSSGILTQADRLILDRVGNLDIKLLLVKNIRIEHQFYAERHVQALVLSTPRQGLGVGVYRSTFVLFGVYREDNLSDFIALGIFGCNPSVVEIKSIGHISRRRKLCVQTHRIRIVVALYQLACKAFEINRNGNRYIETPVGSKFSRGS